MQSVGNLSPRYFVSMQQDIPTPTNRAENSPRELGDLTIFSEAECNTLTKSLASLSETATEIQVNIGKHLGIEDVVCLSRVSKNLNKAMSMVITDTRTKYM